MLNRQEARSFIGGLFGIKAFESPYGPLVTVDTVLRLLEPLVVGGFVVTRGGDKIQVSGLDDPPPAVTASTLDEVPTAQAEVRKKKK